MMRQRKGTLGSRTIVILSVFISDDYMECGGCSRMEEVSCFQRVTNIVARDAIIDEGKKSNGCLFSAGLPKITCDEITERCIRNWNEC